MKKSLIILFIALFFTSIKSQTVNPEGFIGTILGGTDISISIDTKSNKPTGIRLPSLMDGTLISFLVKTPKSGGLYVPFNDPTTGSLYTITVVEGLTPLIPQYFNSVTELKVKSNATESSTVVFELVSIGLIIRGR